MVCLLITLGASPTMVQASVWDNAVSYYNNYGNEVVFRPTSTTDGILYYGTRGGTATTGTHYRAIGWKMTIKNQSGTKLQTLYYQLGGSYMTRVDNRTSSGYKYNLYSLSLYNIKRRLNDKASKAMADGEADITLDACMIVVKNGKAKGAMNDSGPTSGTVYTTYSGIAGAANWSAASKSSFTSYFGKTVSGLFVSISTKKDSGISGTTGAGSYCYGTYVTLTAACKKGYDFVQWEGSKRTTNASVSFYATASGQWTASSSKKTVKIIFHRNQSTKDTTYKEQTISYGTSNAKLSTINWKKDGEAMLGWALTADATKIKYEVGSSVSDSWLLKYEPEVDLYAVWKEPEVTGPPEPAPSAPTPSTPTPSPPTPSPPTPSEPSSETPEEDTPQEDTEDEAEELRVRFISSKYFEDASQNLIPSSKGGLAADSKWATDASLRVLLRRILSKT
jgi:hypothetical protein